MSDLERIEEFTTIIKIIILVFVVLIVISFFLNPVFIIYFEAEENPQFDSYQKAFYYNFAVLTNPILTNSTVITDGGKMVVGIFSVLKIFIFGLIAGIILTSITIQVLKNRG